MATFDSAWCLAAFNRYTSRLQTGDSISDADKYERLSEGQASVIADVMVRCPDALNPKVPYTLFPQPWDSSVTAGAGTLTITGASYLAGATLTLTASTSNFSSGSVGRTLLVTDPSTQIPVQVVVTAYSSGTVVSGTCAQNLPAGLRNVAATGWGFGEADNAVGQVFSFGIDANGYPLMPMGKAVIFPSLASWPDFVWIEGLDYINEGTQIRLPNNRTWTGPLYWYGVVQPPNITASVQPVLFPEGSRELIVYRTAAMFAEEGEQNSGLADRMEARYQQALARWCLSWKTQWSNGGALGSVSGLRIAEAGGALNGRNWSAL